MKFSKMNEQKLTRRYVYDFTFKEVEEFAAKSEQRTPNNKFNFPFWLEQYIKALKKEEPA